jgi:hypothetical protein
MNRKMSMRPSERQPSLVPSVIVYQGAKSEQSSRSPKSPAA